MRPPTQLDVSAESQFPSQGEGVVRPEHLNYNDDLAAGIKALKEKAEKTINDPSIRKKVIESIMNLEDVASNVVPRNQLKKGKNKKSNVNVANIVKGKRNRVHFEEPNETEQPPKKKVKEKIPRVKFGLKRGDIVSVAPEEFDGKEPGSYSAKNPERCHGVVIKVWAGKKLAQVEYSDGSKYLHRFEKLQMERIKVDAAFMVTVMIVNALKAPKDPLDKDGWPKNFFKAIVSPDWREWILAIKKEIAS
jgi:hypothetical protein